MKMPSGANHVLTGPEGMDVGLITGYRVGMGCVVSGDRSERASPGLPQEPPASSYDQTSCPVDVPRLGGRYLRWRDVTTNVIIRQRSYWGPRPCPSLCNVSRCRDVIPEIGDYMSVVASARAKCAR